MSTVASLQKLVAKPKALSNSSHAGLLLQRKCACGSPSASLTGECAECKSKKLLQTKLAIGASNDPLEQEADRVADQVMAVSSNPAPSGAPPRIQRYTGQTTEGACAAPPSVDRVLASSGRPLEPALRQDMEQRFGHDFSRVRVHSGAAAEQSARDINAHAYTVGDNIVFGAGRLAPATHDGQRLIAHELTHVVQQPAGAVPSLQRQPDAQSGDSDKEEAGDKDTDDPIEDYETGADNEVAPEEDADADEDKSFAGDLEPLQAGKPPTSGKWILVKLPRTLIRFEGSKRISSWGISGGRAKNPTPTGSFSIGTRDENHTSNSYGTCDGKGIGPDGESKCKKKKGGRYVGADMHFFQQFAPSVGFHRGNPAIPSHGCIHVSAGNAETLWKWSVGGTPVVVCSGSACDPFLGTTTTKKRKRNLQAKLTIGVSNDPLEQEADLVADQVMAAPAHSAVSGAPLRIQRYAEQATGGGAAPASVDRVLASPGRPLEPALRQDMEQRFDHDFSRVRMHFGGDAEQSAWDVNANAYTAGNNIVFGAGRFAPGTHQGRRLLAHELTHVVQQSGSNGTRPDSTNEQLRVSRASQSVDGGVIQRDGDDATSAGAFNVPTLDQLYNTAVQAARQTGNWQDAAEKLNGFNREDIQSRLAQLTSHEVGYIHLGALDNPRVGPDSQVAQLTKPGTPRASTAPPTATKVPPARATAPVNNPSPITAGKAVSDMTDTEKLIEAYGRANIKAAEREKLSSLISPEALVGAIIGFALVFVASQFTPVGWAADIGIVLTAVFVGTALFTAIEHLIRFADARNATTPEQLDQAGAEFAQAVAEIEVDAIILLVTHGVGGGPKGGAPYRGPPPTGFVLATTGEGVLVPVAANTISAELAAQLGIRGAIATGPLMSRGSGQRASKSGARTRDFEPPKLDHETTAGDLIAGNEIPKNGAERNLAIESWTRVEQEEAAHALEKSIPARQAEQLQLGETSVGPEGQQKGAAHRDRIEQENDLLRAIRKKLGGS